jgi:hypothetical protein
MIFHPTGLVVPLLYCCEVKDTPSPQLKPYWTGPVKKLGAQENGGVLGDVNEMG